VLARIDVHTKNYFEHLKRSWKNENDEERGRKEKERSIQNKRNQRVAWYVLSNLKKASN